MSKFDAGFFVGMAVASVLWYTAAMYTHRPARACEAISATTLPSDTNMVSVPSYSQSVGVLFEGEEAEQILLTRELQSRLPAATRITQADPALTEAFGEDFE